MPKLAKLFSHMKKRRVGDSASTDPQSTSSNDSVEIDERIMEAYRRLSADPTTIKKAMRPKYFRTILALRTTSSERIHNLIKENAIAASECLKDERRAKRAAKKRRVEETPDEVDAPLPQQPQSQPEKIRDTDAEGSFQEKVGSPKKKGRLLVRITSNVITPLEKSTQAEPSKSSKGVQVSDSATGSRQSTVDESLSVSATSILDSSLPNVVSKSKMPFFMSDRSDINKLSLERQRNLENKMLRHFSDLTMTEANERLRKFALHVSEEALAENAAAYDPYEHRKIRNVMTNFESVSHMIRSTLELGIIRMPYAFMSVGLYPGVVGTIMLTALVNFCIRMLVRAKYEICKKLRLPFITFGDAAMKSFEMGPKPLIAVSSWSAYFVDTVIIFCQLGKLTAYTNHLCRTVVYLFEDLHKRDIDLTLASIIIITPTVLIMFIRDLKRLAILSMFANLLVCGILIIVLGTLMDNLPKLNWAIDDTARGYLIFMGVVLSNWSPFAPALAVECHMKNPESFFGYFGSFNVAMAFSITFYIVIGFFGFWKYGNQVHYNIIDNVELTNEGNVLSLVAYFVVIYFSFAVQAFLPLEIIWESYMLRYLKDSQHQLAWECFLVITFTTIPFVISSLPHMNFLLTTLNIIFLPILQLFYPALIDFCLKWRLLRTSFKLKCYAARDILIMIISMVACISATYVCYLEAEL